MTERRRFLVSAASLATSLAWLNPSRAAAQGTSNIVEYTGDVLVNGRPLARDGLVQTGDRVKSGPGSTFGFTIDRDAFLIRPDTDLVLMRSRSLFVVNGARLVTGALLSVFGRSDRPRMIATPTVTAGIRGTGFYVENRPDSTYLCTCFGAIDLAAGSGDQETVTSARHQARRILAVPGAGGRTIMPAPFENHDDTELDGLARLVGQRAPWYTR